MRFLIRKFCRAPNLPHNFRKSQRATRHNYQLHCVCLCHLIVVCASILPRLLLPLLLVVLCSCFPFLGLSWALTCRWSFLPIFAMLVILCYLFPSCCFQPLFSTGHNQLEVVFCGFFFDCKFRRLTCDLHTLRRAVKKRDLKSFLVKKNVVVQQVLYQLTELTELTKCFFFKLSN